MINYQQNKSFFEKYNIKTYDEFLRRGLSNKQNPIYIDQGKVLINAEQIVNLIHSSGGLAFIAHTYKYAMDNHIEFLEKMLKQNIKLDGIEVNYSSFTKEQEKKLIEFSKANHLYMSGGSDYHGKEDRKEKLGRGTEGNPIPDYIEQWYDQVKETCL